MKSMHLFSVAVFCLLTSVAQGRILVDYGQAAENPAVGSVWNTVDFSLNGAALVDDSGAATGVTVTFDGAWIDASLDQGVWPAGSPAWVAGAATADYVFNTTGDVSTVSFSGLNAGAAYRFEHVAARALGNDRIADYSLNGSFADSIPNGDDFASLTDGWKGGSILIWNSVTADASGAITLTVDDVQNFGYVSASLIEAVPEPSSILILLTGFLVLGKQRS